MILIKKIIFGAIAVIAIGVAPTLSAVLGPSVALGTYTFCESNTPCVGSANLVTNSFGPLDWLGLTMDVTISANAGPFPYKYIYEIIAPPAIELPLEYLIETNLLASPADFFDVVGTLINPPFPGALPNFPPPPNNPNAASITYADLMFPGTIYSASI